MHCMSKMTVSGTDLHVPRNQMNSQWVRSLSALKIVSVRGCTSYTTIVFNYLYRFSSCQ